MVTIPQARPSELNAFGTIVRLSLLQHLMDLPKATYAYTTPNNPVAPNNDIYNTPTTKTVQTND